MHDPDFGVYDARFAELFPRRNVGIRRKSRALRASEMQRRRRPRPFFILEIAGLLAFTAVPLPAADEPKPAPLPDVHTFLSGVRERLHSDEFLLDQYTFTERHTERHLDSLGNTQKVTSAVYEVYPSGEPGRTYRRLVEENGK